MATEKAYRICVLIPVYNHDVVLGSTMAAVKAHSIPIIVINDGSNEYSSTVIEEQAEQYEAELIVHSVNRGKGAAIRTGLQRSQQMGFTHALQIDADGQHNPQDIPLFLHLMADHPEALIVAYPEFDHSVPKIRFYGRYLTHIWVWINTLSTSLRDSMCGFRLYPVERSNNLLQTERIGDRMEFDCEFLVRWYWRGFGIEQLQTKVIYPENGCSNFKLFSDNARISYMHARLFVGMLWRLPRLLVRNRFFTSVSTIKER